MTKEDLFHIVIIFCVAAISLIQVFSDGLPIGHDLKNQIISYDLFINQFNEGELYPRWLKDANQGLGGLNFFYYPPLVYYSASLIDTFTLNTLSIQHVISANILLWLFLSGVSFYIFANSLTTKKLSLIGALIYIFMPYHFWHEIYMRNATAELSAYAWIPVIFLCLNIKNIQDTRYTVTLSLAYAALIMSHIPSALFTSVFIGLYALIVFSRQKNAHEKIKYARKFIGSILMGIGLSCIYFFPAATMMKHLNSQFLWSLDILQYYKWFLYPQEQCPEPYLCKNLFSIALFQFLTPIILFFLLPLKNADTQRFKNDFKSFFLLSCLCFFLMTGLSKFIWEIAIPLQKIQFPWRLLVISDFVFVTLLLKLCQKIDFDKFKKSGTILGLVAFVFFYFSVCIYMTASLAMILYSNPYQNKDQYNQQVAANLLTLEHIPQNKNMATSVYDLITMKKPPLAKVSAGNAEIKVIKHTGRLLKLQITAQSEATIQIRQFYFKGWRLQDTSTGQDYTDTFALRDAKPYGQIEFDVTEGTYNISVTLVTLKEEKIGAYISMISLIFLLLHMFQNSLFRQRHLIETSM